jgi:hypothetical protein
MAPPLTVKTEPALVTQPRYLPNMDIDRRTEDPTREADPHTPIDCLEAPKEQEMMIMRIEAGTQEDSRFITRMRPKTIRAALESHTKT